MLYGVLRHGKNPPVLLGEEKKSGAAIKKRRALCKPQNVENSLKIYRK